LDNSDGMSFCLLLAARRALVVDAAAREVDGWGDVLSATEFVARVFFVGGRGVGVFVAGAFLAGAFFAGAFLAGAFFAGAFLAGAFFAGAFLAGAFFAADFFAAGVVAGVGEVDVFDAAM
jgi:uncharacterized protein YjbI with pentapeptide repeats